MTLAVLETRLADALEEDKKRKIDENKFNIKRISAWNCY